MSKGRYYFSNVVEDDVLCVLAVGAKLVLQKNEKIIQIFQKCNELLYGQSPQQALYLMKQNKRYVFSLSPSPSTSSEDTSCIAKPNQELCDATPAKKNPNTSSLLRKLLLFGDTEETKSNDLTLEDSTITRYPTEKTELKDKDAKSTHTNVNETIPNEQPYVSPTSTKEVQGHRSPNAETQESPRSAEISNLTAILKIDDNESASPVLGSTVGENIDESKQRSFQSAEIPTTANLAVGDKVIESSIAEDQVIKPVLKADNVYIAKEAEKSPNVLRNEENTPSPIKISKLSTDLSKNTPKATSLAEMVVDSAQNICTSVDKDASSNEANKAMDSEVRKRKSPNTMWKTNPFKYIPRIVQSSEDAEISVEVRWESGQSPSPTTSSSPSTDRGGRTAGDRIVCESSPESQISVMDESKTNLPSKNFERQKSYSKKKASPCGLTNTLKTNSPGSDDDAFPLRGYKQFESAPNSTSDLSTGIRPNLATDDSNSNISVINYMILKFMTLRSLRDDAFQKTFGSLLDFRDNLEFLISYLGDISDIVMNYSTVNRKNFTKEFLDIVDDLTLIFGKLERKLRSWRIDVDLEIESWVKCFDEIQRIKRKNEPIFLDGIPRLPINDLQAYEMDLKSIWKRMDEMTMLGDSRRSLFFNTARDFENLITFFVKSLILLGILNPQ